MRNLGLHIRLTHTLPDVAQRAIQLNLPIFQCFFIQQGTNQFITPSDEHIKQFVVDWRSKFANLYLHGSYWINLASAHSHNKIITREIELAKKLEFTHIIVHPGSSKKVRSKNDGIATIARNLNKLLKTENQIKIVLENTAHAGLSIGGDLNDFLLLRERLDHPEKILYCIDTAHAYAYGYDITKSKNQADFIESIGKNMGYENIALIHLNDINQSCGSRIDKHEKVGSGFLSAVLPEFINHEVFKNVPIILELPVMDEHEEQKILETVRTWIKE